MSQYIFHIVEDHPLFLDALKKLIEKNFNDCQINVSHNLEEFQAFTAQNQPLDIDLLLLDLEMPDSHGVLTLLSIRESLPTIPVAIISSHEEIDIISRCMFYGASGYINKSLSLDTMSEAISSILEGNIWLAPGVEDSLIDIKSEEKDIAKKIASLTPQQLNVLQRMQEGLLNKQIAYEFDVTEATIKAHCTAIYRKFGVNSRTQAVIFLNNYYNLL